MSLPIRLCLLFFPICYGLLAVLYGQDANWDLRNYHWYNAYAFLNGRYGTDLLASQTPYFYNPILDLPLYLVGTTFGPQFTAFLLGLVQGLNFVLLFTIARRVMRVEIAGRDRMALLVAFIGMIGGGVLGELGTCFYDNVASLGILAGVSILVLRLQQHDTRANFHVDGWKWFIAGIPFGLVTGFKLPTAVYAVGCGLALVLYPAPIKERLRRGFFCALGMGVGLAVALGPWAYHLYEQYGNPLFPYFNDIFLSPYAPPTSARDLQFMPHGLTKAFFPFAFTAHPLLVGEVPWRDIKLPLLYILLPVALLLTLRKREHLVANDLTNPRRTFLLWAGVLSYAAWLQMFAIYRYAVPLEMMAGLLLFCAIDLLHLHAMRKREIFVGLALIALASVQVADWGRKPFADAYVSAQVPAIDHAGDTMLLMAGYQPYSHVIPSFPAAMPVVRIQSNFASPGEDKGINPIIKQRIADHKGHFQLLLPVYDVDWVSDKVLPQFGLKTVVQKCQTVTNNLGEDLRLCPVNRTK